jgi:hypothetical protein
VFIASRSVGCKQGVTRPAFAIIYDRLSEVRQGTIVENKRLGHVLQVAQFMQEQRDSRRGRSAPARTNQGLAPVALKATADKKVQRKLDAIDLAHAIVRATANRTR